jgi:tetratricopeptide (TPR) repeat protein
LGDNDAGNFGDRPLNMPSAADIEAIALAFDRGQFADMERRAQAVVVAFPQAGVGWKALGLAQKQQGKNSDAAIALGKAISIDAADPESHNILGATLADLGRLSEAEANYRRAIELQADFASAHNNLGNLLLHSARPAEAVNSFYRAIASKSDFVQAHSNLGNALRDLGHMEEATASYRRALLIDPTYAVAHANLGVVLKQLGRLDEALASYRRAVELRPQLAQAHNNLGNVLLAMNAPEEAEASHRRAIELRPDVAEFHCHLGDSLRDQGRLTEAEASFERAIELKPNLVAAHHNMSYVLLARGDFDRGLAEHEWRKASTSQIVRWSSSKPAWTGEQDVAGRRVLVHYEQGLGDTLQYCRYLKTLRERDAQVLFLPQAPLKALMSTLDKGIRIVDQDIDEASYDLHCSLHSLPFIFNTRVEAIPAEVPYLSADPSRVERWRSVVGKDGFKVGIAWQGSPQGTAMGKAFPLAMLAPIAGLPNVRLISLQKNAGQEQIDNRPSDLPVMTLGKEFDSGPAAFLDTAAVMQSLDLIITADTSIAHLAGALARPTWVALFHSADWRWLRGRSDSPWYPTMRLFRQKKRNDWPSVFADMTRTLQERQ